MADTRILSYLQRQLLTATALLLVVSMGPALAADDFFDYKGSAWCAECHVDKYSGWLGTGHGKMVTSCEESLARSIPLPAGHTCDNVSYVIGGHGWKVRYLDENGYFVTSVQDRNGNVTEGMNQWNLGTQRWSDYHAGEEGKPYDCGACHTTGWKEDKDPDTDGDLSDNQDGRPGIHGTFALGGVQCEACHGPGYTMEVDETTAFCATCHSREPTDKVQASDGYVRHQQQYNELLTSPHSRRTCITCHNPHESGEGSLNRTCQDCHSTQASSYEGTKMQAAGVDCIDCHMPRASKSGEPISPSEADVRTHIFRIGTAAEDQDMFTEDGAFVRVDSNGKARVNVDFACKSCHGGQSTDWLMANARDFHDQAFKITGGMSGTWWAGADHDGEGWLLDAAANAFVAAMFTYDAAGNQAWLLGAGAPEGDMVATSVEITEGPSFGPDFDPDGVVRTPWGTANFLFVSCTEGTVELQPNAEMQARGFEAMTVNLERLTESAVSCSD